MFGSLASPNLNNTRTAIEFAKYVECLGFLKSLRAQIDELGALDTLISQEQPDGKVYALTARQLFDAAQALYSRNSYLSTTCTLAVGRNQLDTILYEMVSTISIHIHTK